MSTRDVAILGFDYASLTPEIAAEAQALASRIRAFESRMTADAVAIGRDLIAMKEKVGHGNFGAWIAAEFKGGAERTAQRYMSVVEAFGEKSDTLTVLPLTAAYALAAKSTPARVREDFIQRIESGATVTPRDVISHVRMARNEAKRAAPKLSRKELQRRNADPKYAARQRRQEEREEREIEDRRAQRDAARDEAVALIRDRLAEAEVTRFAELLRIMDRFSFLADCLAGPSKWGDTNVADVLRGACSELEEHVEGVAA